MYPTPDLETAKNIHERMCAGNLNYLLSFDENRLDAAGNVECRSALILAGALGPERKPDVTAFEPSWHHIYGVYGWTKPYEPEKYQPYYPAIATEHVDLARAIYAIATNEGVLGKYISDSNAFSASYELTGEEAEALVKLDENELRENFSINPMITYWAKLAVGRHKHKTAS
jgi:2,3-dihydroxyphenylpropionate 1,2-dioxygenase